MQWLEELFSRLLGKFNSNPSNFTGRDENVFIEGRPTADIKAKLNWSDEKAFMSTNKDFFATMSVGYRSVTRTMADMKAFLIFFLFSF